MQFQNKIHETSNVIVPNQEPHLVIQLQQTMAPPGDSRVLARIQTLTLEVVGPLATMIEQTEAGTMMIKKLLQLPGWRWPSSS